MGRIAGVPNRLTTEVKGLLQDIIDEVIVLYRCRRIRCKSENKAVTNIASVYITTIKTYNRSEY